jgi:DNA invertase Pin-like site-specific DNA recombinase
MTQIKVCQFLRVSTCSQSTSRQREELNALCVKNNWDVVRTIEEIGSGAKKNKDRESIYELLKLVDSGKINKVIVNEMSRLGRTTAQSLQLIEKLSKRKVSVFEYQRNIETLNDDVTPKLAE